VVGIDISEHCDAAANPQTIIGDIRQPADLQRALDTFTQRQGAPIDLIIHCAAAKHDFGIKRSEYFDHNKYGTRILLEFAARNRINKLINISTVSVFGHPLGKADEDAAYAPDHPYGESKLAGELLAIEWQKQDPDRELVVLRPTVIYGPHNYANVYKLIRMMHRRPYVTVGKGDHVKSVVSLDNMVGMILFSMEQLKPGYQHFNCVDEPYITLRELMQTIAANPGFRMPRFTVPLGLAILVGRIFDLPAKLLSVDLPVNSDRMRKLATSTFFTAEKIRRAGYKQERSIQECITGMCKWYLTDKI
jgi:nucleoside-diphosphate-sugar epimerase